MKNYDFVLVVCPHCGVYESIKVYRGLCEFGEYKLDTAPQEIVRELLSTDYFECSQCDNRFEVVVDKANVVFTKPY